MLGGGTPAGLPGHRHRGSRSRSARSACCSRGPASGRDRAQPAHRSRLDRAARERASEALRGGRPPVAPGSASGGVVIGARDMDERTVARRPSRRRWRPAGETSCSTEGAGRTIRDVLHGRVAAAHPVGTYGITITSGSRVDDRVAISLAIDDAVSVAVAEDLLEPDMAARLADPGRALLGLDPPARPRCVSRARPDRLARRPPPGSPAPRTGVRRRSTADPQAPPTALGTHLIRVAPFSVAVVGCDDRPDSPGRSTTTPASASSPPSPSYSCAGRWRRSAEPRDRAARSWPAACSRSSGRLWRSPRPSSARAR